MKALTLLNADAVAINVDQSAITRKQSVLSESVTITEVSDEFGQELCVSTQRSIKDLLKLVEDSRQEIKAPILELGRKIDGKAKEFSAELQTEFNRLNGLNERFIIDQRKKAAEAEAARQAELKRIEAEQRRLAELARVAEELRIAEEARIEAEKRAAAEAEFNAVSEAEQAEAATKADEIEKLRLANAARDAENLRKAIEAADKLKAKQMATQQAPAVTVSKPSGSVVKDVWVFEVTDAALAYKSRPEFFELTERKSVISQAIASGLRDCPGLRIYQTLKTGVR